jgi:hypothetical protein
MNSSIFSRMCSESVSRYRRSRFGMIPSKRAAYVRSRPKRFL